MITRQQVFDAALKYAQEQNPTANKAGVAPNDDFIAGAEWAAEQLQAENAALQAENERMLQSIEIAVTRLLAGDGRHSIRIDLEKALEK